jgi:putative transposase
MNKLSASESQLADALSAMCEGAGTEKLGEVMKKLYGAAIERMLDAEMDAHLGCAKHDNIGDKTGNSRNGYTTKTLKSEWGDTSIKVPRDRNGSFVPSAVAKNQSRTGSLEQSVISMYGKGMTDREIGGCVKDLFGAELSPSVVSRITDEVIPDMREWQARPLDDVYPVAFFDGVFFKCRSDGKIVRKCAYSVMGIGMDGKRDILGIWISESESASFWLSVFNELSNRGVKDILIACHDNLSGFTSSLKAAFPSAASQLCIVHQIRSSLANVGYKEKKAIAQDLKMVYGAASEEEGLFRLEQFAKKHGRKHPSVIEKWERNWCELAVFFKYNESVRKLIYTTNPVEGFHRMLRKFTKAKTSFPNETAIAKSIYLSVLEIGEAWSKPVRNWPEIRGQLLAEFPERLVGCKL